ncbi:acetaldehyde dehydrogenase [Lentibacillus persicus]|uniref:Acetaldehyde dehydrogenase n=1 Tax=Lentibacillus persicus TaxID=640948 RepID=A0A1I1S7I6_9BACI|nr:acetaldehyde dehydrogenase (acetylating) [Lentibacillus persicus]SFD42455.1 acetaldehyde dehydrogenase [Lentibacillus persicus]
MSKIKAAILGSGNIGTDLMYKILKKDGNIELSLVAGIDPESEGLQRAREAKVETSHEGIKDILADPDIKIVFDATSAKAHMHTAEQLSEAGKMAIDLTPAAIGPYLVPPVNLNEHIEAENVNMVSCAGQATTPLVYAVSRVVPVHYAEMIATVASRAIGPGTRQNVDEFTRTTANSLEKVGGAKTARAIPVFNPAEPPITMANTVYTVIKEKDFDVDAIKKSINDIIYDVADYVPGYRLKSEPIIDYRDTPWGRLPVVVIMNEVEGEGDFFPQYAGNLDIMTASARKVGDLYANHFLQKKGVRQ